MVALPTDRQVFMPRHAAEVLTGCRLDASDLEVRAHMPLPRDESPSLGHLAVLIDVAIGQSLGAVEAERHVSFRTIALDVHLTGGLVPGQWVTAVGRVDFVGEGSAVTSCEVVNAESGARVALGAGRFMAVNDPTAGGPTVETQPLDCVTVPGSWSHAFGLPHPEPRREDHPWVVSPDRRTANGADLMHGGLQGRMLDMIMRSGLNISDSHVLGDLSLSFGRGVSLSGGNGGNHELVCIPRARQRGRRLVFTEVELQSESGAVLTSASGTYIALGSL